VLHSTLVTQGVAVCQLTSTSSTDSAPVVHRRVLIADSNSQCVQVFSATTGECLLKFGVRGRQASQLQRPTGVAVTANGNYLIADYDNKWVGVFSPEGKYINRWAGLPCFYWCYVSTVDWTSIEWIYKQNTGWPLVWKTWKCQGIWQLSEKCQGFY